MDDPAAEIQSGSFAMAARRARALVSGEMLSIAHESFLVSAETIDLAESLVALVGGFPVAEGPPSARFSLTRNAIAGPTRVPDERYQSVELWRDADELWLRHDSGFTGWASPAEMRIGGNGEAEEPLRRLFLPLATHVLAHRGVFVLHGGAADAGAGAMLFLGATGSGKSSLVGLSLLRRWRVLGDDIVALMPEGDRVSIVGIPRPPAIPAEAVRGFVAKHATVDGRGRLVLDPHVLDTAAHPLIGSVLPFRALNRTERATEVAPTDLFHELVGSFPAASNPELLKRFLPIAGLVARLPAYRLPLAREGAERFIEAGAHLDAVATQLQAALP